MQCPTLKTATLGCKVNQYETQYLRQALLGSGYRDAEPGQPADLCVVNTCTVTAEGDAKSRQLIRRMARHNPAARIVVVGCYARRAAADIAALPGVTDVVADRCELADLLAQLGVVHWPAGIDSFGERRRAYIKVQDGCLLRCSFCIIPQVRPQLISRPPEQVLDEIRRLVDRGYRELVLAGIHLGHYGVDLNRGCPKSGWIKLSHLLERIVRLPGRFRVRLSSIEATETTRALLAVMAEHPDRIVPHLHVSMQSGSDTVLRRMRRRWGSRRLLDRLHLARAMLDRPALTTDILVGFPGESEREFDETCRAARAVGFAKIHVFPFSPRTGTAAASMPNQVSQLCKRARCQQLRQLAEELRARYMTNLIGRRLQVLVETPVADRAGLAVGTACRYVPVELAAAAHDYGQLRDVVAIDVANGRVLGQPTAAVQSRSRVTAPSSLLGTAKWD